MEFAIGREAYHDWVTEAYDVPIVPRATSEPAHAGGARCGEREVRPNMLAEAEWKHILAVGTGGWQCFIEQELCEGGACSIHSNELSVFCMFNVCVFLASAQGRASAGEDPQPICRFFLAHLR